MRVLAIDYGDSRVGLAVTDALGITAQGLKTIFHKGQDKLVLSELDKVIDEYEIGTIVVGMPISMSGNKNARVEITEKFIHKLKCKYNKIKIEIIDERLTTVQAHKTMNDLAVDKKKKRQIVDTISAVYILETYINKSH